LEEFCYLPGGNCVTFKKEREKDQNKKAQNTELDRQEGK